LQIAEIEMIYTLHISVRS